MDKWIDREELINWIDKLIESGVGQSWVAASSGEFRRVPDFLETKIRRGNVFNLVMSRLGSDLGPIRSEFAFDPT